MSIASDDPAHGATAYEAEGAFNNGFFDVRHTLKNARRVALAQISDEALSREQRFRALFTLLTANHNLDSGSLNDAGDIVRPTLRAYVVRYLQDPVNGVKLRELLGPIFADELLAVYANGGPQ